MQPLFAPETFVRIDYSPLLLQWQFLTPDNIHLAWYRALRWADNGWWAPLLLLLTLGLFMIALYRRTTQREPVGYIVRSREGLYGVTLGIVTLVLLGFYLTTLTSGEVRQAARRIEQSEQRGDAIVNLVPGRSQEFANVYHGRLPIYGFAPRSELDDTARGWMARLRNNAARLWVLRQRIAGGLGVSRTCAAKTFCSSTRACRSRTASGSPSTRSATPILWSKPGWAPSSATRRA